ncbi:MAG: DegT/DnrJ/EryC1/StrS family aminotransferase [Limnobacter sp.]|nr:DegT/DnrJ/EryC1/StrS family aminotransferase [Limnobacter sp.]
MTSKKIFVTKPSLPPLEEFLPYLEEIWESRVLTNCGPFHHQLEDKLCDYLGVPQLALCANGSIALLTALQTLRITGEVITTPYSFVSTSHSLLWNTLKPVFVDIDPVTLNLDPERIEEAITPQTTAIMPVHCYGTPCDVERIQRIADIYGLKTIYDAAHAFGVKYKGESLLNHGDLSVLSLHATKVFNTFEGGAIVCKDATVKERIGYLKNFGFANEVTVTASGINGKMSEFNAALGLLQLKYIDEALGKRRSIEAHYREQLANVAGITLLKVPDDTLGNSSYFPIFVQEDYPLSRDELYFQMREQDILGRRYFYPLISDMPMYRKLPSANADNLPRAHEASQKVICLPIYPDLPMDEVQRVCEALQNPKPVKHS